MTGHQPRPGLPLFGVEVEAERLPDEDYAALTGGDALHTPELRELARYWRATTDGSLRHNGVEWVTQPLDLPNVLRAADMLYVAMRKRLVARRVLESDDVVDRLNATIFRHLVEAMERSHERIRPAAHMLVLARHLERLADHATNIAEDVIFLVEARLVKHHQQG